MDASQHQLFAERVVRNQHRVFRYIVSMVPNPADADELFQQTCLSLWENWERYDAALEFVPWACGFAHNHIRNFLRRRQNSQVQLDADVIEILALRWAELRSEEDRRMVALRACLAQLPEHNRGVIESYYGGMKVPEIALQRRSSVNAVYKLLDRLRLALHECVTQRLLEGSVT